MFISYTQIYQNLFTNFNFQVMKEDAQKINKEIKFFYLITQATIWFFNLLILILLFF